MALTITRRPGEGFQLEGIYDKDGNELPAIDIWIEKGHRIHIDAPDSVSIYRDELE